MAVRIDVPFKLFKLMAKQFSVLIGVCLRFSGLRVLSVSAELIAFIVHGKYISYRRDGLYVVAWG